MSKLHVCLPVLGPLFFLFAPPVVAADRHVFLDTNGNGTLNDCPNPAHNAKGTSNTDDLQYCSGGSSNRKVIGTAAGRVLATTCSSGGGTVSSLTLAAAVAGVDVDGDGAFEPLYAAPQACVWNMAKSDSCEVHAGTYAKAGAVADQDATTGESVGGISGVCDRNDCWFATVVAWGEGPNLDGTGYGTAPAPGYLRGAVMNGSTDSWDSNGNKVPDTVTGEPTSYPAIFSGDLNGNGAFDKTICSGGSCSGDAFYGLIEGCGGGGGYGSSYCRVTTQGSSTRVRFDTNGDGSYETGGGVFAYNSRKSSYFTIKDIEFTRYNGGNGATGGARIREGMLSLEGNDGATDGIKVDHIYMHDNDYSLSSGDGNENYWTLISDSHNSGCTTNTEVKNSLLYQNNEKVLDDDCGEVSDCGCPKNIHDNRVIQSITSSRVRIDYVVFAYLKSIDVFNGGQAKAHRLWNNEFIYKATGGSGSGKFLDLQAFGNSRSQGKGELWIYGNIFRADPAMAGSPKRMNPYSCSSSLPAQSTLWRAYYFNNTVDVAYPIDELCSSGSTGELLVEKNNAWFRPSLVHATTGVTTIKRTNEVCSATFANCTKPAANARTDWFSPGSYTSGNPDLYGGLANYRPKAGGPLVGAGSCDPDGDGTAGVDYNWDGVNDTTWTDLAGNTVSCPTVGTPIAAGAIQSGSAGPVDTTPPATVTGAKRTDKKP